MHSFESSKYLEKDEKVIWSGKPVKAPFILAGLSVSAFGLLWLSFSMFAMWLMISPPSGATVENSGLGILFVSVFVLIGFGLTLGPPIPTMHACMHLLEKNLIEFEVDEESPYRLKPRKYGLSKNYVKLTEELIPLDLPPPEELLKKFGLKRTEELTIFLLMAHIELGFEMFKKTLTYPETYGPTIREYVFSRIENLTEAYRAIIFERNEPEKALQVVEEFREFVNQKLDEKYHLI